MNRAAGTADMNRVVATAATDRADMTPATPVAQVGRAAMTRVGPADLANPGDTILVDRASLGPGVTTRVGLGDMTRERPGAQSRADLAMPADTIPVGRAVLGRRPVRRPPMAEPPLRTRALLHLRTDRRTVRLRRGIDGTIRLRWRWRLVGKR